MMMVVIICVYITQAVFLISGNKTQENTKKMLMNKAYYDVIRKIKREDLFK